ncbi:AAA-like domain-containing protein [Fulvivirgaceae bacterium BMA10]|uniref:AAA-like domain-containing protein n=1 Tax=Splendidivirga corallicola TaxID=3051826 RepID=A0ABT8KNJ7_9BACT|nr:AAA-like domain-containing protein [Fulvivirgaceae bacterium BMA10]
MRNDLQLIQSVFCEIKVPETYIKKILYNNENTGNRFNLYKINISFKYKGLIDIWFFAILQRQDDLASSEEKVINEGFDIFYYCMENDYMPLVIINDNEEINLKGKFAHDEKYVFFIDQTDLPTKDNYPRNIRNTPLINSIKNRLGVNNIKKLCPYIPQEPAEGWRFFGRKKEQELLTDTKTNVFIIGGRKLGKTSLVRQFMNFQEKNNNPCYYVPTQNIRTEHELVESIGFVLSKKMLLRAKRESSQLNSNFLLILLKKFKVQKNKLPTLIIDEVGGVIQYSSRDAWNVFGVLREFSQTGNIRIILTAFQEIVLKQFLEFESPFVNFAKNLRLRVFNNSEVKECIIEPLSLWATIKDQNKFLETILEKVGNHPYLIQFVGEYLFDKLFEDGVDDIEECLDFLFTSSDLEIYREAVETMFFNLPSSLEKFLFLHFCLDASESKSPINKFEISHKRTKEILEAEVNLYLDFEKIRLLLERIELRGLITNIRSNHNRYHITAPAIYYYLEKFYSPIHELMYEYKSEAKENGLVENLFQI